MHIFVRGNRGSTRREFTFAVAIVLEHHQSFKFFPYATSVLINPKFNWTVKTNLTAVK